MADTSIKDVWQEMATCSCHIEGLRISYFHHQDDQPELDEFYVSLWSENKYNLKPRWKHRLKHVWQIIRKGHPWDDEIVLDSHEAARVAEFLKNPTGA